VTGPTLAQRANPVVDPAPIPVGLTRRGPVKDQVAMRDGDPDDAPTPAEPSGPARYWRAGSGFWRGRAAGLSWCLTGILVLSTVVQIVIQYRLNLWSHDFFNAFERRDGGTLRIEAMLFVGLAGLSISVAVMTVWSRMTLQREWRAWLTRQLIERWLAGDRFHRLRFELGEDENPEYRIAEDVRVATDAPIALAAGLLGAALGAVTSIGILWNVGGDLAIEVAGHGLTVPKYLVLAVGLYSAVLTLAMTLIARRMMPVIAARNVAEAQFRAIASKVREASARAGPGLDSAPQHGATMAAFDDVVRHWRALCHQWMRTTMISHGNALAAPIVGWVLCAPKYLVGSMTLGEVAQAVSAFVMVQAALNWLVDNYPGLADCRSSVDRVAAVLHAMDGLERDRGSRPPMPSRP
jgi:putative ATP-binding cassette transporter